MPPAHPQTGDVLDRALHAARTQTPSVPGQTGFFNALKPQSNLFQQTSRVNVANPPAQQRQQARVVPTYTPPQTLTRAQAEAEARARLPHSSSVASIATNYADRVVHQIPGLALRQAKMDVPLASNPLSARGASAADKITQKGLGVAAKQLGAPQPGANVQGQASTYAGILSAAHGVPYASMTADRQKQIKDAVGFFIKNPSYHYAVPDIGIFGPKDKQGLGLPATATDPDVVRAFGAEAAPLGHRGYVSGLIHNIPLNFLQMAAAPAGVADVLTHPQSQGPEFLRQQVQFGKSLIPGIGDPLKTLHDQPVSVITTGLGFGRVAGGLGGTLARTGLAGDAAKAFATPSERNVMPAGFNTEGQKPIYRGMTSPKLDERFAQAAADKLASKSKVFGNRLDKQRADTNTIRAARQSDEIQRANYEPAARASAKLNRHEIRAVTFFHGQGFHTMAEAEAYYTKQLADHTAQEQSAIDHTDRETHADWQARQRDLVNMQKVAANVRKKVGDAPISQLPDKMQKALRLNTQANRSAEAELEQQRRSNSPIPLVTPDTALRRAYGPRTRIDAELHGMPAAERVIQLGNESNRLHADLVKAPETGTSVYRNAQKLATDRPVAGRGLRSLNSKPGEVFKVSKQQIRDELSQVHDEQHAALHAVRSQFRAERGAPSVEQGAPLDVHDPLFFQHVMEGPKFLNRIRGSKNQGTTSPDVVPKYAGGRLGKPGQQSTSQMFSNAAASSDPSVYFGGVAKPAAVAAKLRHFQAQVQDSIIAPKAGTKYDTSKYIDLTIPQSKVHTTEDATAAANESPESVKQKILNVFDHSAAEKGREAYIPDDGQEHYLMTRNGYDNLTKSLNTYDTKTLRLLKRTTGVWRWATLMARPAWIVNNAAGNTLQAGIAGAGPVDMYRAARPGKFKPVSGVENAGQYANVFDRSPTIGNKMLHPIHAFTNAVVGINVAIENWARRAVSIHSLTQDAKATVHGEIRTVRSSFHRASADVIEAMNNPTPAAHERAIKSVDRALGNFHRIQKTPISDVAAPFHRWFSFIARYTVELPVHTPGRALLLQRLGQFGVNVQNQQFGGFVPNSMQGSIKLPGWLPLYGGEWKGTQGLNSLASMFQLASPNDQSTTNPGQLNPQGLLGAVNPVFGALWNAATGKDFQTGATLKDRYGNPTGTANPRVLGHGIEQSVPFGSLLAGYNTPDDSLNPLAKPMPLKAGQQQPASFLDRATGYVAGSVRPYDPARNRDKSLKRLKGAVVSEARNRLANG